ncbi:biorientation of chromosomes in cell division protein 1-like 1 [Anthonomus grandis grandis]|uniref:biorientation of chromosomes in cell division protein 1-like 1 n=1 Tax=Anthonomus grandis grandis TaxID=2921223 RepID=UPI0021650391|nr:biorientation of chromosomes in cell division protein 1-like 1 [Anthonomus grandis grandis]
MDIISTFLPGDPRLIEQIVYELKSQGIFDQFRRECIADVDTKPAYQNLSQRVETSVMNFLNKQAFTEELNKNQLREQLRKNITESGFLESGVERIVDQVVNPKINSVFLPKVEDVVYKFLGIERRTSEPPKEEPTKEQPDLLPKDLEVVSPESVQDNLALEPVKEDTNDSSINSTNTVKTEDESPPFEPLDETGEEVKVGKVEVVQEASTESNGNVTPSDNDDNKMEICETSSDSNDKDTKVDVKEDVQKESHGEVKVDKEQVKSDKEEVKRGDKRSESRSSSDKHKSSRSERKDGSRSHSRDHGSKSSSRHSSSKDKDKKYGTSDKDKHSKDHHHHRRSSKDKSVRSEKSEKKHKDEVDKEEKKSREDKSKDKSSGRHKSGSRDKERERSGTKHKSSSSKDRDKDKSGSTKSKDKERSKEEKKKASGSEKKKIPDDHYALKDKKTERRSSDRDSNDGSSSKNSRNSSVGEGTGGAAVNLKSNTEEVFNSSPSTESGNTDTAAPFKLIKPKFASNIYEAMRLMKIRKRLAKLERQNQLALAQVDIDPKSLEGAGTVDELKIELEQTDEVEETLRGQDLSMDDFEALEAKLAEEMAKFNANMYGEDEEEDEEEFVKESCHVTAETSMELPELVVNISSCDEQSVTEKRQQENPSSSKLDINENDSKEIKLASDQKENLTSLNENFRGFTPDSVTDPQLAPLQKIIDKMQQDLRKTNSRANIVKVLKEELSQEAPECNPKAMLKLKLIFNELTMSNPAENLVQRNGKKLFLKVEKVKIEIPPKVLLCLEDMGFGEDRYNLFKTPNGLVSKGKRVINAKKRPRSVLASAEEEEEELCYFEGSEVNERTLKVLRGMMGKLERDIERLKLHMQNNIPTPKKRPGRKRKFQDTDGDGSTSSTPDSKKRLISENQTKTGVVSKRYSSDELYKPRPVLSTVNRRRSARNNNPQ